MKLEVGMYVRTKRDGIGKIISLSIGEENDCCFIELSKRRTGIKEHNILKASHNIIDLIEVGDYVNRELVSRIKKCPEWHGGDGIVIYNEHNETIYSNFRTSKYGSINSIVTKEMFSSMEYKVGE